MVHGRSSFLKVFLLVFVMVAVGLAAVAAAKTPAGTVISNQAIAEYKVDGETRRVESNIVYVTVQQVAEVEVKPADTTLVYVVPGQLATIPVTVTNRGNGPDSFTFSPVIAQHPEGGEWDFQPVAGTYRVYIDVNGNGVVDAGDTLYGTHPLENPATFGPVAPDETVSLLVQVRTPVDAAAEEQLGIQVEVESTAGAQGQTGLIILEAVLDGVLTADLSAVSNYPTDTTKVKSDGEITYTVRLTNLGFSTLTGVQVPLNVPAHTEYVAGSLVVNGVPVADPAVDGDGNRIFVTGAINGAQTYTIQYKVVVQNTAEGGSYITNQIEVAYTYGEADRIAQTNEVRTQVLTTYGVELSEPDPAEHDPIQAGGVYSFEFVVTNNGNATDRIHIQTALVQDDTNAPVLWQVELFAANGMTPLPKDGVNYTVGNLPRGESTTFVAKVYVPTSELTTR